MGIKFQCPECGQALNIKGELSGKRAICPGCQAKIMVPEAASAPAQAAPAAAPAARAPAAAASARPETAKPAGSAAKPAGSAAKPAGAPKVSPGSSVPGSTQPAAGKAQPLPASTQPAAGPAQSAAAPKKQSVPPAPSPDKPAHIVPTPVPSPAQPAVSPAVPAFGGPVPIIPAGTALGAAAVPAAVPAMGADPLAEAPAAQWFVLPPGATKNYGPATAPLMRQWIEQGRVSGDSLVWREDWPEWRQASTVFSHLRGSVPAGVVAARPLPGQGVPTAGTFAPPTALAYPSGGAPAAGWPAAGVHGAPFAAAVAEPATTAPRRGAYRHRSNTPTIAAIVILLLAILALIPVLVAVLTKQ